MRVLMNLAFTACRMTPLPAERAHRRTLFILDEVAQVGTMPSLQSAYQTLRSYHVKIWSFYQQWSSLSSQVEETSAITGNATKQFFGCEDMVTAEQIEKFLDKYRHHDGARELQRQLLSAGEVYDLLGQKDMVQIAITGQGDKLQLTRESFIPLGWMPPEAPKEGIFSSWPIWVRVGITAFVACFLLGSFLIIYIEILIPILNMIGLSEEIIKGTGSQWIGGVFFFFFCALTFFFTREVWRRLFRGGRFNFPETLSVVPRSEQKPHLRDIVRTVGIFSVLFLLIAGVALIWFEVPKWVFVLFLSPFFIDVILGFLEEQHDKQPHVIEQRKQENEARIQRSMERYPGLFREGLAKANLQEEQEAAPKSEPEEAGEGIRSEAQQEQERQAESRYTPEQDAARRRWVLSVGFTDPQVDERLPIMLENAGADEVDKVMEEYKLLKACAA